MRTSPLFQTWRIPPPEMKTSWQAAHEAAHDQEEEEQEEEEKKNILFIPRETKTLSHLHSPLTTPYTVHLKVKRGTKGL